MSVTRRVLFFVIVPLLLAGTIAAGLWYRWARYRLTDFPQTMLAQATPEWMDQFRLMFRRLDLSHVMLPRTTDGDASVIVGDMKHAWANPAGIEITLPPAQRDTIPMARWRAWAADTSLDRLVSAARMRQWNGFASDLKALNYPASFIYIADSPRPLRGLRARAEARLKTGDLGGAATDLAAVMGIADQLMTHDPMQGAGMLAAAGALDAYAAVAARRHDAALAASIGELRHWRDSWPPPQNQPLLFLAATDSAYAIAADSALTLGWRVFGLHAYYAGHLFQPRAIIFGVRTSVLDSIGRLEHDPNPEFATVVRALVREADSWNHVSPRARWARYTQAFPRRTRSH